MTTLIRTEQETAWQRLMAEVYEGIPPNHLTESEVDDLARRYRELDTDCILEGKVRRPTRPAND